jgi:hypothetical protein
MRYEEFLEKTIDKGIDAAKRDYAAPDQANKLKGSIEGFEACRGLDPIKLKMLLSATRMLTQRAANDLNANTITEEQYWEVRCREAEVEWVCNCVSVILANEKLPGLEPIVPPTARAFLASAEILGVGKEA